MLNNSFANAPTVGSHEPTHSVEDLQAKIRQLEFQMATAEAQRKVEKEESQQPKRKIRWKRIRKLFNSFIKPILDFVPRVINAVANYKKATA